MISCRLYMSIKIEEYCCICIEPFDKLLLTDITVACGVKENMSHKLRRLSRKTQSDKKKRSK